MKAFQKSTVALALTLSLGSLTAQAGSLNTADQARVGSLEGVSGALHSIDQHCGKGARAHACVLSAAEKLGSYFAAKQVISPEHTEALLAEFERQDEVIGSQIRDSYELHSREAGKNAGRKSHQVSDAALVARAETVSKAAAEAPHVSGARVAGLTPMPLLIPLLMTGCTVTVTGGGGGSGGDTGGYGYSTSCTYSSADPDMGTQWKKNYRAGVYWGCNDSVFGYPYAPEDFYDLYMDYFDYWTFSNDATTVSSSCFDYGYSDGWDDLIYDAGYSFTCLNDVLYY